MARIVMKFGGTSMAGTERIRRVANIVRQQAANGNQVAVEATSTMVFVQQESGRPVRLTAQQRAALADL